MLFKMDIKTRLQVKKIFGNDLVTIHKSKVTLTINKPAYIGICILEMSRMLMYEFHYDYIKNKYDSNSELLFTDSITIYKIKAKDVYQDFSTDKEMFDFSNYSAKSKYYDVSNKLVFGKKNVTTGVPIKAFI